MVRTLRLVSDPPMKEVSLPQTVYPEHNYPVVPLSNTIDSSDFLDVMFNDHCQLSSPENQQYQSENTPIHGDSLPDILLQPTPMTRQYSITTVMEVIDNHKISENNLPTTFSEATIPRIPTQPIQILNSLSLTGSIAMVPVNSNISQNHARIFVASSDMRDYGKCSSPSLSNFSSSPHLPFERYQGYPESTSSPKSFCSQTNSFNEPWTPMETRFAFDKSGDDFTENSQNETIYHTVNGNPGDVFLPSQNYDPYFNKKQNGSHHRDEECIQSTSCPNFCNILPQYPTVTLQNHSSIGDVPRFFGMTDALIEIDPSYASEDIDFSEMDKVDERRIRNNQACKASRQRRKLRKQQIEQKAATLENENKQLRGQIQKMESERDNLRARVMRRMSQS